jgi:DNA-binding transcriptional regulator/RsmH inhibitor MraZ
MKTRQRQPIGPFLGEFETTLLEGGRLRLPVHVILQLKAVGVERIHFGILPHQKALVIIPQAMWSDWIIKTEKQDPLLSTTDGFRSFIFPSRPNWWGPGGRLYIPDRLLHYAGLSGGQLLVILGVGDYFEIWNSDAYEEMRGRCEEALQSPKPALPPVPLRGPDSHSPKKDKLHEKPEEEIPF